MSAPPDRPVQWWTDPAVLAGVRKEARAVAQRHAVDILARHARRRHTSEARIASLVHEGGPGLLPISERVWLDVHLRVYDRDDGRDLMRRAEAYDVLLEVASRVAAATAIRLVREALSEIKDARPAARRASLRSALAMRRSRP